MQNKSVLLESSTTKAEILLDWGYNRSRYDWGGTVGQVTVNGHTFLSRELNSAGGVGLGGVGLTNVLEWRDTALYDNTSPADYFPLLGVGLLKKTDNAPFQFTREYAVEPFDRQIQTDEHSVTIRTMPYLCSGVAVDMKKTYSLEGNTLTVAFEVKNVGSTPVHATEFCHNFFKFDDKAIDSSYCLSFPYTIETKVRRGQVITERDRYRLGAFDGPTESTAFWVNGWQGLNSHWMKLEHEELGMSVLMEDEFPVCYFYSWNNANAFCPETFAPIDLEPEESICYVRK